VQNALLFLKRPEKKERNSGENFTPKYSHVFAAILNPKRISFKLFTPSSQIKL
jgi:hypothetical protein